MNFLSAKQNAKLTHCNCIKRKKRAIVSKLDHTTVFASTTVQSTNLKRSHLIQQNRGTRVLVHVEPLIDAPLRNVF
jgi:hypothetical protein